MSERDIEIDTVNMYRQENVNSRKLKRDYSARSTLYTHFRAYMPTIITGIGSERPFIQRNGIKKTATQKSMQFTKPGQFWKYCQLK